MKWLELVLRLGLGGLFLWTGAAKAVDPEAFFWQVHAFELTPWDGSMLIAIYLPWLEAIAGGALIVRWLERGSVLVCGGLSVLFLLAIASAGWRGLDLSQCGCFGAHENALTLPQHLALNAGMVAASALLWWRGRGR